MSIPITCVMLVVWFWKNTTRSGGTAGGVAAALSGEDFWSGVGIGAASGAVSGGFSGYASAQAQGLNVWTGAKPEQPAIPGLQLRGLRKLPAKGPSRLTEAKYSVGKSSFSFDGTELFQWDHLNDGSIPYRDIICYLILIDFFVKVQ